MSRAFIKGQANSDRAQHESIDGHRKLVFGNTVRFPCDYGAEPFPDDHLFPAEIYRADLEVFPRDRLPVWLAAHIGHADRQSRPADTAARAEPGVAVVEDGVPALPLLPARWAVLSAAFVAVGSPWGPRVLPALGLFEGAERSGSSLRIVPGDRAVLSGGVWNDPVLDAVYNAGRRCRTLSFVSGTAPSRAPCGTASRDCARRRGR